MLNSPIGSFCHLEMLDYLIEDNNLKDVLRQEGISDKDILFIKEMIAGPMSSKTGDQCCKLLSAVHSSLNIESLSLVWIVYNILGLPMKAEESLNGNGGEKSSPTEWKYCGRSEEKAFLYEIVANKISGEHAIPQNIFCRYK